MSASPTLRVTETFLSIQGESTHAGRLCFFIRLAGCNLDCRYCDTRFSRDPAAGADISLDDLVRQATASGVGLVEITGGEPLLQDATPELCRRLLDAGMTVMVETNGALDLAPLPAATIKVLDCKTPSSGEADRMRRENDPLLQPHDEVKFVISDRADYDYSLRVIAETGLAERTANLIFSPAWDSVPLSQLAEWMIADRAPARLQLQLHKYIWGPHRQGV